MIYKNGINFIKLLAAIQVFIGHATVHLNVYWLPEIISNSLNVLQGVPIFFILSGFLTWKSINRTNNFRNFCRKRIFRLYPELWGGVLLNFLIILILYGSHIKWRPYILFQFTQATFLQFWTPDCLRGYGCGTPNGSLWTICVMVQTYIVLWILYKLLHGKKKTIWIAANIIFIMLNFSPQVIQRILPVILYKLYLQTFVPYLWLFILGATISEFYEELSQFLIKYWYIFAIVAFGISLGGFDKITIGAYSVIKALAVGPAIIGFSYRFPKLELKKDFSYGIYIYHMIVINLMIQLGLTGKFQFILIAFILSFGISIISFLTIGAWGRKKKVMKSLNL